MRLLVFIVLTLALPALLAQETPKRKKPEAKKQQVSHKKPTPEQIRKFKELEKKQKRS
jgi:hypothetical protein